MKLDCTASDRLSYIPQLFLGCSLHAKLKSQSIVHNNTNSSSSTLSLHTARDLRSFSSCVWCVYNPHCCSHCHHCW